jgi:N-acetylglutamate synthase-like GNAT family acetyltransferase
MEVTKAEFKDLEYILPLVLEYYETDRTDVALEDSDIIDTVAYMLQDSCYSVVMSKQDNEVTGVAAVSVSNMLGNVTAQEVFWKVDKDHTRSKAGALLLKALESQAQEMGAEVITVVALAGEHEKRIGNSYVSRGYDPVYSTYLKRLG